jgi:hypothetical protein
MAERYCQESKLPHNRAAAAAAAADVSTSLSGEVEVTEGTQPLGGKQDQNVIECVHCEHSKVTWEDIRDCTHIKPYCCSSKSDSQTVESKTCSTPQPSTLATLFDWVIFPLFKLGY